MNSHLFVWLFTMSMPFCHQFTSGHVGWNPEKLFWIVLYIFHVYPMTYYCCTKRRFSFGIRNLLWEKTKLLCLSKPGLQSSYLFESSCGWMYVLCHNSILLFCRTRYLLLWEQCLCHMTASYPYPPVLQGTVFTVMRTMFLSYDRFISLSFCFAGHGIYCYENNVLVIWPFQISFLFCRAQYLLLWEQCPCHMAVSDIFPVLQGTVFTVMRIMSLSYDRFISLSFCFTGHGIYCYENNVLII